MVFVSNVLPRFFERFNIVKLVKTIDYIIIPCCVIAMLLVMVVIGFTSCQTFVIGGVGRNDQSGRWEPVGCGEFWEEREA